MTTKSAKSGPAQNQKWPNWERVGKYGKCPGQQGHASGKFLLRDHCKLTEFGLRVRALLHSFRSLVRKAPVQRRLFLINQRLKSLEKRRPDRARASGFFLGAKVQKVLRQHRVRDKLQRRYVAKIYMRNLKRDFGLLSHRQRLAWTRERNLRVAEAKKQIRAETFSLEEERARLDREETELKTQKGTPNQLTQARFTLDLRP